MGLALLTVHPWIPDVSAPGLGTTELQPTAGDGARVSKGLFSHWALLLFFLFILLLEEDLKGNCTLIPRSAPERGGKEPHNSL